MKDRKRAEEMRNLAQWTWGAVGVGQAAAEYLKKMVDRHGQMAPPPENTGMVIYNSETTLPSSLTDTSDTG